MPSESFPRARVGAAAACFVVTVVMAVAAVSASTVPAVAEMSAAGPEAAAQSMPRLPAVAFSATPADVSSVLGFYDAGVPVGLVAYPDEPPLVPPPALPVPVVTADAAADVSAAGDGQGDEPATAAALAAIVAAVERAGSPSPSAAKPGSVSAASAFDSGSVGLTHDSEPEPESAPVAAAAVSSGAQQSAASQTSTVQVSSQGSRSGPFGDACERYRDIAEATGDWDADVVMRFMWRESRCDPLAVSPSGDWGLLQMNAACHSATLGADPGSVPSWVPNVRIVCDGAPAPANRIAGWCYHAKEAKFDGKALPASPCDAWLDPDTNLRAAYRLWDRYGWAPWCFNAALRSGAACRAARAG